MSSFTPPSFDLTGRVALVTGASRGIGAAIAETFSAAGARVVLVARNAGPLTALADTLRAKGGEALAVAAHIGYDESVAELRTRVSQTWGDIDILVNNAATNPHFGPLTTADAAVFEKTFSTNVLGCHRMVQAFAPGMRRKRAGKIINITSIAGHTPAPGLGVYGVTKAALMMMTRTLARELGEYNVQVNGISPGLIRTDFSQALVESPDWSAAYRARSALGRIGETGDLTGLALYLASPASDYTTGCIFPVEGGYLL